MIGRWGIIISAMQNMLTSQDLEAIGQVVEDKIGGLKTDVATLKTDVGTLKSDVSTLKEDMSEVKTDIADILETTNKGFSEMEMRFGKRFDDLERQQGRTDGKVNTLVNIMEKKRVITEEDKQAVLL